MTYSTDGVNHQKPFPAIAVIYEGKIMQASFVDYKAAVEYIESLKTMAEYKTATFLIVRVLAKYSTETVYRNSLQEFK